MPIRASFNPTLQSDNHIQDLKYFTQCKVFKACISKNQSSFIPGRQTEHEEKKQNIIKKHAAQIVYLHSDAAIAERPTVEQRNFSITFQVAL